MKVIGVVTLVVFVSAILSCGDGVPTQESATGNKGEAITVSDENTNTITPVANVSGTGLNPAHGLPGHRCDIGVGQPLNSKPATQPSSVINPVTTATTPNTKPLTAPFINPNVKTVTKPATNITPTTESATGLNPPHGQPGHRCGIPVGKPLNSNTSQSATQLTNPTPTTTTTTTNPITVAPGMNPPHGQPGHRCGIPVGKPLNSKPAQTSLQTSPTTPLNSPAVVTKDSTKG